MILGLEKEGILGRIGVIIQGPLVTYGQGPNRCTDGFDSFETISANLELIKKLGMEGVVCTWAPSGERESRIAGMIQRLGHDIILLDVPKLRDPDHRYKHHFAIKRGFDHLVALGAKYILKIRTDMRIPEHMFLWLCQQVASTPDKFIISELYEDGMTIGDFIYCADRDLFGDFLESFLSYGNFNVHPSIGVDVGMKFFLGKTGVAYNPMRLPMWLYHFWFLFVREKRHFLAWREFVYDTLAAPPRHLWDGIIWRGKPMPEVMDSSSIYFYDDIVNRRIQVNNYTLSRKLAQYKAGMLSYYGKRMNKNLLGVLKTIRRCYIARTND